jgi:hypothetical protein
MFHKNKPMSLHPLLYSLCVVKLTLCYQSMVFACSHMLSLLTLLELISFCGLLFLVGLMRQLKLKTKKGFYHNWFPIDMFFPLVIEIFGCLHQ